MLFSALLVFSVLGCVSGDIRVPILSAPVASFNLPFFGAFINQNPEYYNKVTTYDVWQTPRSVGDQVSPFDVIVDSSISTILLDANVLLNRGRLSVAILEQRMLYNCSVCYSVKDADIANYTSITATQLENVTSQSVKELHDLAVETIEKKFCFNMAVLEQTLNLSSLNVINNQWPLFVPPIVAAAIKCRADRLGVTVDELVELLDTTSAILHSYNMNELENIFFPAFDNLVARKNLFETQAFSVSISGIATSQWQSQTMAYYANQISQFSVRDLEILYRWASPQLFAIENIPLSAYFSFCNSLSTASSAFSLSQNIFGYQASLPSCNVAFFLSRSLNEDEGRFNLTTITDRNILNIIRNASGISSWFDFYQVLFAISEGIWMETPLISQVQVSQGLTNAQIRALSVPQIASAIRTLNGSGALNSIMQSNYQQHLNLLLQTYGLSKSSLASLMGRTVSQIDSLTIQEAHNLVFEALYTRYNISKFLSRVSGMNIDNFVAINLPSFEWYRLVRAAIESSFDQLSIAFSTNLTVGGGVFVVTLADGMSSIQIQSGRTVSSFVISAARLALCLGGTVSEVYGRTLLNYQALYQNSAVDLMNKKIILETENFNSLLARITFENIRDSETVSQTIENRVGLTAAELQCMYGWSAEFTSFLSGITWRNVSLFRLCGDFQSWPLHRIAVELSYSTPTVCQLCSNVPCDVNADCTDTVGSYICTCRTGFTGNGITCTGTCQADTTGEDATQGRFFWNVTAGNVSQALSCPYGYNSSVFSDSEISEQEQGAIRSCQCNDNNCQKPYWNVPDTARCKYRVYNHSEITRALTALYQEVETGGTINASSRLVDLTNDTHNFGREDVNLTVLILEKIVNDVNVLNKSGMNIIKTIDNFLNVDPVILFQSQKTINSSARVLSVVEGYLGNVALCCGENVQQNEKNIAVFSQDFNQTQFQGARAESRTDTKRNEKDEFIVFDNDISIYPITSQISLTMPKSLFKNLNIDSKVQNKRISFVVYRKHPLFQTTDSKTINQDTTNKLNSWVISGSIQGERLTNLQDPIVTTYQPLKEAPDRTTACVFWDFSLAGGVGDWSQTDCHYKGINSGIVTCHCFHLTNFAILTDVDIYNRVDDDHEAALSIISYIGCAISLGGLVLTIITILLFKELRTKAPTQILLNFCIALSLTLVVFFVAVEKSKTSSTTSCRVAAIALHYFVLAVFMWMAIEAYNMYICFVKILPTNDHSNFMIKCLIFGWGLPAIIVIITAAFEFKEYGDKNYCRLQGFVFQVAFLAPVVLILLLNVIAFVLILHSLLTSGTKVTKDRKTSRITQARRSIAILVLLGLTWVFGVLAIKDAKVVFQYLFCIFNSLQGLLVFLFQCVLSKDTRQKWKALFLGKTNADSSTGRNHRQGTDLKLEEVKNSCKSSNSNTGTS